MEHNGGYTIVMGGKNCIAIASDLRSGNHQFTIGRDTPRIFRINQKTFIAMTGLVSDIASLKQEIDYEISMHSFRKNMPVKFFEISTMLSNFLYQSRFSPLLVENIVCGLDEKLEPFVGCMDVLGAKSFSSNFAVSGTPSDSLHGLCENFWKPNLEPAELFQIIAHCLTSGTSRNCLGGWGCIIKMIVKKKIFTKIIKTKIC